MGTLARLPPASLRYEEQEQGLGLAVGAARGLAAERGVSVRELWRGLGLPRDYWAELVLLRAEVGQVPAEAWDRAWEEALQRVRGAPLSPRSRDPRWVENSFLLLRARELERRGKDREALDLLERVILPFGAEHFPYWYAREQLGDLYRKLGHEDDAIKQYELAAFQYKVFKRFPLGLQMKLYRIFRDRGDLYRASDAIGELVRVDTDDPAIRRLYAELLRKRNDRHAARQTQEADFYGKNAVKPGDEREILKP
jgi:tetratricopeptide (TPR) repeat protein